MEEAAALSAHSARWALQRELAFFVYCPYLCHCLVAETPACVLLDDLYSVICSALYVILSVLFAFCSKAGVVLILYVAYQLFDE